MARSSLDAPGSGEAVLVCQQIHIQHRQWQLLVSCRYLLDT